MPDTDVIIARSDVTYGRGVIQNVQRQTVICRSIQGEEAARRYLCGLGYKPVGFQQLPKAWAITFANTTDVADTDRGDKVAVDGRYELRDG